MKLLRETEGIDPDPAAAIATAALISAAEEGTVGTDDHILLNLTGGGYERVREDLTIHGIEPAIRIPSAGPDETNLHQLEEWVARYG